MQLEAKAWSSKSCITQTVKKMIMTAESEEEAKELAILFDAIRKGTFTLSPQDLIKNAVSDLRTDS